MIKQIATAAVVLGSLVPGAAVIAAAEAQGSPESPNWAEQEYVDSLASHGIVSMTGDYAPLIKDGWTICRLITIQVPKSTIAERIWLNADDSITIGDARNMVNAAQNSLCPSTIGA